MNSPYRLYRVFGNPDNFLRTRDFTIWSSYKANCWLVNVESNYCLWFESACRKDQGIFDFEELQYSQKGLKIEA